MHFPNAVILNYPFFEKSTGFGKVSSKTFSIFDEILRSKNGGIACSDIFSFEPSSLAILESGYNSKMASAGRRHVLLTGSPGKYLCFLVKKSVRGLTANS